MFDELNKVRTDPTSLIPYVQNGITEFNGNVRNGVTTTEGAGAWQELETVLGSQQALEPMTWSNGMANACQLFVEWSGPNGVVGHNGPSGKSMTDRINEQGTWSTTIGENLAYGYINGKESLVQLMVDDGVASRGHRNNILKTNFGVVGIAIYTHSIYSYMTCMDFAGGFTSSQDANPTYTWSADSSTSTDSTSTDSSNNSSKKSCSVFHKKKSDNNGKCKLRWEYVILVTIIGIICIAAIVWGIIGYTRTDICCRKNKGTFQKNEQPSKLEKNVEKEVDSKTPQLENVNGEQPSNIKDNAEQDDSINQFNLN